MLLPPGVDTPSELQRSTYWKVTDDHIEAAIASDPAETTTESDEKCTEAAGTCPQSGAASGGTRRQVVPETAITALPEREGREKWAIQDSNNPPSRYQEPRSGAESCPQSGAPRDCTRRQVVTGAPSEHELKVVSGAWANLPQNIRLAILALVEPFSRA